MGFRNVVSCNLLVFNSQSWMCKAVTILYHKITYNGRRQYVRECVTLCPVVAVLDRGQSWLTAAYSDYYTTSD